MNARLEMWFGQLRAIRRALLTLAILFFAIMLLEVDLGHAPALARHSWLALIPVVWLPITLLGLIAVDVHPSPFTVIVALIVTVTAAVIGMTGSGLHMQAAGVDLEHLGRVFSSEVWGGRESPNWPVAITLAAVFGFAGALGASANRNSLPGATSALAYLLIVAGVLCAAAPGLMTIASACLAVAALLLLAALIATLAGMAMERSFP